jgi:hypothetical protein
MKSSELILTLLLAMTLGILYSSIQRNNRLKEENDKILHEATKIIYKCNASADRWNQLYIEAETKRFRDSIRYVSKASPR